MGFMDKLKGGENYVEVEHSEEAQNLGPMTVEVERMDNYADADRIQKKVREGSMLIVRIRDLRAKDMEELKRSVERVRRTCLAVNGDIAGLGDEWILVTPAKAKIHREASE